MGLGTHEPRSLGPRHMGLGTHALSSLGLDTWFWMLLLLLFSC